MLEDFRILDISQPVSSSTACFPGDVPFSKKLTLTYGDSNLLNLTALTMSPHVGTHADAPVHVRGDVNSMTENIGALPLSPYVGSAVVVDIAPTAQAITWEMVSASLSTYTTFPKRILFRTADTIRYDVFEKEYAWFDESLVEALGARGVTLMGIDTPSVDHVDSKTLATHHALMKYNISWLENLDLTRVAPGEYFLIALPLKFLELEASPVRAVLLASG